MVKILIAVLGLASVGGAVAYFGLPPVKAPVVQAEKSAQGAPTTVTEQSGVLKATPDDGAPVDALSRFDPPEFDIVRVEPTGELVVAGRAPAGATVELLRDGAPHATAIADTSGQFAMVPPDLAPGDAQLSLVARAADGRREVSRQSVTVSVPDKARPGDVVVALSAPDKPTRILSGVTPAVPSPPVATGSMPQVPPSRPGIVIVTVEAEDSGLFFATGSSAPQARVRLYLNDTYVASAQAGEDGRWSFTVQKGVDPGRYRVRLDDIEAGQGTVLSRAEIVFEVPPRMVAAAPARPIVTEPQSQSTARAPAQVSSGPDQSRNPVGARFVVGELQRGPAVDASADVIVPEIRTATVMRGDSLWRISQKIYGKGLRYTVIHEANQQQIRDPDRIYPGQVFVLPGERQF